MKCLVLSFLMGYNGQVYKKGDYVEVEDEDSVKRLVRERCIEIIAYGKPKELERGEVKHPSSSTILNASEKAEEEKAEEEQQIKKFISKPSSKRVSGGIRKNARNDKL